MIVTYGMLLKNLKESNKELLSKIYAKIDGKKSSVPFVETEEVLNAK